MWLIISFEGIEEPSGPRCLILISLITVCLTLKPLANIIDVKGQMQRNLESFLLLKIFYKNISYTNRKQNQLSKLGFAQTVALKIRKSYCFREHYENEPEMAAPRLETNIRYL